jgi:hypothetical protein
MSHIEMIVWQVRLGRGPTFRLPPHARSRLEPIPSRERWSRSQDLHVDTNASRTPTPRLTNIIVFHGPEIRQAQKATPAEHLALFTGPTRRWAGSAPVLKPFGELARVQPVSLAKMPGKVRGITIAERDRRDLDRTVFRQQLPGGDHFLVLQPSDQRLRQTTPAEPTKMRHADAGQLGHFHRLEPTVPSQLWPCSQVFVIKTAMVVHVLPVRVTDFRDRSDESSGDG